MKKVLFVALSLMVAAAFAAEDFAVAEFCVLDGHAHLYGVDVVHRIWGSGAFRGGLRDSLGFGLKRGCRFLFAAHESAFRLG